MASELKALDDALRLLPEGSEVRAAADSALEGLVVRLLELMVDRLVATTRPTARPPAPDTHECVLSGGSCMVCGRGAPEASDFRLTATLDDKMFRLET